MTDWDSIVREHGKMAFATAWRILGQVADAEDAVQDAFVDALRLRHSEEVKNWGGLLRRLVTQRALDRLRKRRRTGLQPLDPAAAQDDQPFRVLLERELCERLRMAVADLPDRESSVFSLRHFAGMSTAEVAEALRITKEAVAAALHKARGKLKEALDVENIRNRET